MWSFQIIWQIMSQKCTKCMQLGTTQSIVNYYSTRDVVINKVVAVSSERRKQDSKKFLKKTLRYAIFSGSHYI